jgi:hypothetical protein
MNIYLVELGYDDDEKNYHCIYRLVKAVDETSAMEKVKREYPNYRYKIILYTIE